MHVAALSLTDFRSYTAVDLELRPGVTSFIGPNGQGKTNLVEAVGYSRALELCATGRFVGAEEAVRMGLATLAVPPTELSATTSDLVQALLGTPPAALWALKPLLNHALTATIDEQVVRERVAQGHLLHGMARAAGLS